MTDSLHPQPSPGGRSGKPDPGRITPTEAGVHSALDLGFAGPDGSPASGPASLPYVGGPLLTLQQSSSWQGPYPSPDAVERFEAVLPGAFDRILAMAEKAQASQIQVDQSAQVFLQRDVRRSHYLGAAISALAVVCSTGCALTDHPVAAVALVGIPVMAVARAFIKGSRTEDDTAQSEDKKVA